MVFSTQFIQRSALSVVGTSLAMLGMFSSAAIAQDDIDDTTSDAPPEESLTGNAADIRDFDLHHGPIFTSPGPVESVQVPEPSSLLGLALVGGFCLRQRAARKKCAS